MDNDRRLGINGSRVRLNVANTIGGILCLRMGLREAVVVESNSSIQGYICSGEFNVVHDALHLVFVDDLSFAC